MIYFMVKAETALLKAIGGIRNANIIAHLFSESKGEVP